MQVSRGRNRMPIVSEMKQLLDTVFSCYLLAVFIAFPLLSDYKDNFLADINEISMIK